MSREDQIKLVEYHVRQLNEHFEAVQIMVCGLRDDGGTEQIFSGRGLWHARTGLAHEFLQRDDARNRADETVKPDDDDDKWKESV